MICCSKKIAAKPASYPFQVTLSKALHPMDIEVPDDLEAILLPDPGISVVDLLEFPTPPIQWTKSAHVVVSFLSSKKPTINSEDIELKCLENLTAGI